MRRPVFSFAFLHPLLHQRTGKRHSARDVKGIIRDRAAGALTVRLRRIKTNFGPQRDPLSVELAFRHGSITEEPTKVDATELAGERTLNAEDRVLLALG